MKRIILLFALFLTVSGICFAQWSQTSSTGVAATLRTVSAVDDNIVWAGGASGVVIKTTNGGTNWQSVGGGALGTDQVNNIFGISATIALCTTSPSSGTFVFRTSDGGTTWVQVFSQTGGFIDAIWMTSNTNGFMMGDPAGARWSLWKTSDGGVNWDSTGLYLPQNGSEAGWNNSMMILGSNIWFNTNGARIYYSSNNGTNWIAQTTPSAATAFASVWFNSPARGLASWNTTPLFSTNGGTSWASGTTPPGSGNIAGIIGGGFLFWIVRNTAMGIYKTTDYGTTWTTDYTAPAVLWHIALSRTGAAGYAVGASGGVSKNPLLFTGVIPISGEVPSSFYLAQNYPNPFNPQTTINFSLPKSAFVSLKVYDVLGNEVLNLVNENKTAGNYAVRVDGTKLSSGVYFYTLNAGDFTRTKKMIMIK
jgi:photosystem II stability/assembly factor-like uncharacterized protein